MGILPGGRSIAVHGEADLVDADDIALLPVALGALFQAVVAVNAPLLHPARGRIAERRTSREVFEPVERPVGGQAELAKRFLLESVLRASLLLPPRERMVAVEADPRS